MALGSSFVLGLAAGSKTLPLVNGPTDFGSEYYLRDTLKSYRVRVRHSNAVRNGVKYDRHNVEVFITTFATSSLPESYHTAYMVVELLPGDTYVEPIDALADWVTASSNANVTKLYGWES
jgi:hypothetical protein